MANIYRTLLREIEADGFQVLHQRTSLTPVRKLWIAARTHLRGALRAVRRIAVIGAGWAGLAAAVAACEAGQAVTLFEMAGHAGGRARSVEAGAKAPGSGSGNRLQAMGDAPGGYRLDNGQHILIGAYQDTLALMRRVGVSPEDVLHREPLAVVYPDGSGLCLPAGPAVPAFVRGVLRWRALPLKDRLGLLAVAARWRLQGFRCPPGTTVAELARHCPASAYTLLLEPLCVAALNTPAAEASGQVLLTVLRDALFGPPGASDLLLPKAPLDELLPTAALAWLARQGAHIELGHRVQELERAGNGWLVDGVAFDQVVLAASASEAARLLAPHAPGWAAQAAAFEYQPIITVWLQATGALWPRAMLALKAGPDAPAQFGFDLGALGGPPGLHALVVSGAAPWVALGLEATAQAVEQQLQQAFAGRHGWPSQVQRVAVRAEKRATFACVPGLVAPRCQPAARPAGGRRLCAGPLPRHARRRRPLGPGRSCRRGRHRRLVQALTKTQRNGGENGQKRASFDFILTRALFAM